MYAQNTRTLQNWHKETVDLLREKLAKIGNTDRTLASEYIMTSEYIMPGKVEIIFWRKKLIIGYHNETEWTTYCSRL